jgi:hypothetical protein
MPRNWPALKGRDEPLKATEVRCAEAKAIFAPPGLAPTE